MKKTNKKNPHSMEHGFTSKMVEIDNLGGHLVIPTGPPSKSEVDYNPVSNKICDWWTDKPTVNFMC